MATIHQLEIFIAVAETLNMSLAAKKLFISQPTVSQIISDLEKEYQTSFFERHTKRLELTPEGKLFRDRAADVLSSYENLNHFMYNAKAVRQLRCGATLTIGNTLISELISRLKAAHPDIESFVTVENTSILENRLIHNELDIAMIEGIITNEKIVIEPVMKDTLLLICGNEHRFRDRESISSAELKNESFIMRENGSGTRAIFEDLMLSHHIPLRVNWECCSSTAIIDAVLHNHGISVISKRCAKPYLDRGALHACTIDDMQLSRYFYLCYNRCHPMTSQMKDFISLVKEADI